MMGIEPIFSAWQADVLPLDDIRPIYANWRLSRSSLRRPSGLLECGLRFRLSYRLWRRTEKALQGILMALLSFLLGVHPVDVLALLAWLTLFPRLRSLRRPRSISRWAGASIAGDAPRSSQKNISYHLALRRIPLFCQQQVAENALKKPETLKPFAFVTCGGRSEQG